MIENNMRNLEVLKKWRTKGTYRAVFDLLLIASRAIMNFLNTEAGKKITPWSIAAVITLTPKRRLYGDHRSISDLCPILAFYLRYLVNFA